jgi:hypothetical protein
MLLVVACGILSEGDEISSANHFPQAVDAHDGLLLVVLQRLPLKI